MRVRSLVKKAKKGSKEALLKLIMEEQDSYYRLAYSYMKNEDDAMNCLQDMIIRLYEKIGTLREDSRFYTWSKTILVNICKDELERKKKLIPMEDYRLLDRSVEVRDESQIELEELLSRLDRSQAELIRFKHVLGYDYRTIAEIFDLPIGTVKSRIHKGLRKLEAYLREDENYVR